MSITYRERQRRAAIKRKRDEKFNSIGCRVWEQSGVGVKGGVVWHVTNTAVDKAVEVTYRDGILDEEWIATAVYVLQKSWGLGAYEGRTENEVPVCDDGRAGNDQCCGGSAAG
jgi:hypothetical protein